MKPEMRKMMKPEMKKMTKEAEALTLAGVSKRAQKMYALMRRGRFYTSEKYMNSPIMRELYDAGLVGQAGRAEVYVACYVPVYGYTPMVREKFEDVW